MGTTNTRVYFAADNKIFLALEAQVGVRDAVHSGSDRLKRTLKELLHEIQAGAKELKLPDPACVIGCGMLTSEFGLLELAHLRAPAGINELAEGLAIHRFPDLVDLPFILIRGVRCGPSRPSRREVWISDVIRGEESLCVGLSELGVLDKNSVLINLGSHWKVIALDEQKRISRSLTTISGELIHTIQTETLVASAVGSGKPEDLDEDWLTQGMKIQRKWGLARAIFCLRLLERNNLGTQKQRLSHLIGSIIAADLDAWLACQLMGADSQVVITGGVGTARAFQSVLRGVARSVVQITGEQVKSALVCGMGAIVQKSGLLAPEKTGG